MNWGKTSALKCHILCYDAGSSSLTATVLGYQPRKMQTDSGDVVKVQELPVKGVVYDRGLRGLEIDRSIRDLLERVGWTNNSYPTISTPESSFLLIVPAEDI